MIDFAKESKQRYQLQEEFLGTEKPVNRTQPVVSVSVATYQHAGFIEQCLDGILAQETDFPYEIILGEDGSEDGTRDICIEYATKCQDKIRLFLRDRKTTVLVHEGRQYRFNGVFCRMSARGKYIALCEGDDYWTDPHKLQKQVEYLEAHPECSMCFHDVMTVYEEQQGLSHSYCPPDQKDFSTLEDLVVANFIPTCSVMYRNRLVDRLPDWYYALPMGDWPLHVLNAQHGHIGYLSENMAAYRKHQGGVWSGAGAIRNAEGHAQFYRILLAMPDLLPGECEARKRTQARLHWMLALCLDELGLSTEAKLHFRNAVADDDLLVSDPEFARKQLLYFPNGLRSTSQFRELVHELPSENDRQRSFIKRAWSEYHAMCFFENSARRRPRHATHHWVQAIFCDPTRLKNVGMWSIAADNLIGAHTADRFRRSLRSVRRPKTQIEMTL